MGGQPAGCQLTRRVRTRIRADVWERMRLPSPSGRSDVNRVCHLSHYLVRRSRHVAAGRSPSRAQRPCHRADARAVALGVLEHPERVLGELRDQPAAAARPPRRCAPAPGRRAPTRRGASAAGAPRCPTPGTRPRGSRPVRVADAALLQLPPKARRSRQNGSTADSSGESRPSSSCWRPEGSAAMPCSDAISLILRARARSRSVTRPTSWLTRATSTRG